MQLLQYPRKPHELSDDLQSFVYILAEGAVKFHLHNYSDHEMLSSWVSQFFDECFDEGGYRTGGYHKLLSIESGLNLVSRSDILRELLARLYKLLKQDWDRADKAKLEEYRAPSKVPAINPPVSVAAPPPAPKAALLDAMTEGGRYTFKAPPQRRLPSHSSEASRPSFNQPGIFSSHRVMAFGIAEVLATFTASKVDKVDDQLKNRDRDEKALPKGLKSSHLLSSYSTFFGKASTVVVNTIPPLPTASMQHATGPSGPKQTSPECEELKRKKELKRKRSDDDGDGDNDNWLKAKGKPAKKARRAGKRSTTRVGKQVARR